MIIYPLPAIELDDKTLSQQIKAIAQVLCNVHHLYWDVTYPNQLRNHRSGLNLLDREQSEYCLEKIDNIPLTSKGLVDPDAFTNWGLAWQANYLKLVDMLKALLDEHQHRFWVNEWEADEDSEKAMNYFDKYSKVYHFCACNALDLPNGKIDENCGQCNDDDTGSYGIACDTHAWGTPTPFPLVMPKKYIIYKQLNNETRFNELSGDENIIESYRNYYRTKLIKKLPMSSAPMDGTEIIGIHSNGDLDYIRYAENRKCMLAGVGGGNGYFGEGWECAYNHLIVDTPDYWAEIPNWTRGEKPEWLVI